MGHQPQTHGDTQHWTHTGGTNRASIRFYWALVSQEIWRREWQQMKSRDSGGVLITSASFLATAEHWVSLTQCHPGQRKQKLTPESRPRPLATGLLKHQRPDTDTTDISGPGRGNGDNGSVTPHPGQLSAPAPPRRNYMFTLHREQLEEVDLGDGIISTDCPTLMFSSLF